MVLTAIERAQARNPRPEVIWTMCWAYCLASRAVLGSVILRAPDHGKRRLIFASLR
jgi:hypothetical protein